MNGLSIIQGGGAAELAALSELSRGAEEAYQSDFYKALSAGAGTDHATLVGGAALRRESIESSLLVTVQKNKHFVFWNKCPKSKAISTVDEWSIQRDIGGIPGSGANTELGDIAESTGDYARQTATVKFLMDKRRVSVVAEVQSRNGLASAIAKETDNGTKKLLTDANYLSYFGRSDCVAAEFDGLEKIMRDFSTGSYSDHVLDLRGRGITANAREFVETAQLAWSQGNWGQITDYFCSAAVQGDVDQKLDPAHRVNINGAKNDLTLGAPVKGIHTNFGDLATNIDPFITEGGAPYSVRGGGYAALQAGVVAPASVAGVAAPNAASKFTIAQAGNYYWAVEGGKDGGARSALVKSGQVAVSGGDGVTVTITHGANSNCTYFQVYRSRQDGTNADGDFREMLKIAASQSSTTVYVDLNAYIPGTSIIFCLTMLDDAVTIRRLMDMTRFPLYPTTKAEHVWAQLLFAYLRVGKPNQHRIIVNVLPSSQVWRPFN